MNLSKPLLLFSPPRVLCIRKRLEVFYFSGTGGKILSPERQSGSGNENTAVGRVTLR